jgi:hypothetical protein
MVATARQVDCHRFSLASAAWDPVVANLAEMVERARQMAAHAATTFNS